MSGDIEYLKKIRGFSRAKDEIMNELNKHNNMLVAELNKAYELLILKTIKEINQVNDIKAWLLQKQIYFGWNHTYDIKKPIPDWMITEPLGKLIRGIL